MRLALDSLQQQAKFRQVEMRVQSVIQFSPSDGEAFKLALSGGA
jgi:hypothetical protein